MKQWAGRSLVVVVAFAGAWLVAGNVRVHPANVGYDAEEHIEYAMVLGQGRLPRASETHEFFGPPLAYLPGAVAARVTGGDRYVTGKAMQWANVPLAAVSLLLVAALVTTSGAGHAWAACAAACVALLPVFQRTFAMARPEPLVVTLSLAVMLVAARLVRRPGGFWSWIGFGLLVGSLTLTRQWGFLTAVPASLVVVAATLVRDRAGVGRVALSAAVACVVGAPFYLHLWARYGSPLAFNRQPPAEVVTGWNGSALSVFTRPTQHDLAGTPLLLLYADVWGDYWLEWSVYGRKGRGAKWKGRRARPDYAFNTHGNYARVLPSLRRAGVLGLVPTAVGVSACVWAVVTVIGRRRGESDAVVLVSLSVVAATAAGYGWFVVTHGDGTGDVVKATYVLHALPVVVVLAAVMMARWKVWLAVTASGGVLVCLLLNARMLSTAYG